MNNDELSRLTRNANVLMYKSLALSVTGDPANSGTVIAAELQHAALSLMAACVMLMKRCGIDDDEAKQALQATVGIVFDAVHFVPKAVGSA
jgi:hypothetical protein